MSRIRFPNDKLVKTLMRRQDNFWRQLRKKQEKENEAKKSQRKKLIP